MFSVQFKLNKNLRACSKDTQNVNNTNYCCISSKKKKKLWSRSTDAK